MKELDFAIYQEHLPALVTRTVQTDHEVRKKSSGVLYLMRLLRIKLSPKKYSLFRAKNGTLGMKQRPCVMGQPGGTVYF